MYSEARGVGGCPSEMGGTMRRHVSVHANAQRNSVGGYGSGWGEVASTLLRGGEVVQGKKYVTECICVLCGNCGGKVVDGFISFRKRSVGLQEY